MADSKDARRWRSAVLCAQWLFVGFAAAIVSGCGGPKGYDAPEWDPDAMADAAMKQNDTNSDGILDAKELAAAPGLKAAAEAEGGSADANGDKQLTRDEIRERIAYYQERNIGMDNVPMNILLAKQPLAGATAELVPEPFLAGVLTSATTTTRENGFALFEAVRPGMYRVKVTHPSGIPPKYNENTSLGIEVIPQREGYSSGPKKFELEKS